jgi:hypothetical protein
MPAWISRDPEVSGSLLRERSVYFRCRKSGLASSMNVPENSLGQGIGNTEFAIRDSLLNGNPHAPQARQSAKLLAQNGGDGHGRTWLDQKLGSPRRQTHCRHDLFFGNRELLAEDRAASSAPLGSAAKMRMVGASSSRAAQMQPAEGHPPGIGKTLLIDLSAVFGQQGAFFKPGRSLFSYILRIGCRGAIGRGGPPGPRSRRQEVALHAYRGR